MLVRRGTTALRHVRVSSFAPLRRNIPDFDAIESGETGRSGAVRRLRRLNVPHSTGVRILRCAAASLSCWRCAIQPPSNDIKSTTTPTAMPIGPELCFI